MNTNALYKQVFMKRFNLPKKITADNNNQYTITLSCLIVLDNAVYKIFEFCNFIVLPNNNM